MCTKLVARLPVFVLVCAPVFAPILGPSLGCGRRAPSPAPTTTTSAPADARVDAATGVAAAMVPVPPPPPPPLPDEDRLPAAPADLPPERRAVQVIVSTSGVVTEQIVDTDVARARGLTVVDLSDDWAPSVLERGNRYRAVYVGLATDKGDGDGQPLTAGERNYLELYGVPPALSVLRRRFLDDAARRCDKEIDVATLLAVDEVRTWGASSEQKELGKQRARATKLEAARVAAGASSLAALAEGDARHAKEVAEHARAEAERATFAQIEARLACEGLMAKARHKPGSYDTAMRTAMLDFQQKHVVMDQADINRSTLEALARPLLFNDYLALKRVLTERAMESAGFLEDGSVGDSSSDPGWPTYLGSDGVRHRVPDLASQSEAAMLARLGIASADDALAFFRRHPRADFRWLKVAVRLPPPPEYYARTMELSAEIDRGDVWYDYPFDAAGVRQPQPRKRYPSFTLFVKWKGERVPLVRWRTTVGGWRAELAGDGQEYYRYKGSDVGPRVWRHVVATPVWIPPPSSPMGGFVKERRVNGTYQRVTNYDETGPGYLSAYGLVAAIHEEMRKGAEGARYFDNGIRTHGSFDYMSLRGRFSHGCHRLHNQSAVRLFSFVLEHRNARRIGDIPLGYRRSFASRGEVFEMRLPTRGFYYQLDPPLPVNVLEGTIKGTVAKPITGYVPKPGVKYATVRPPAAVDTPESRAGGEGQ